VEFDRRALAVLERLQARGHEAYLVGGCVRDWLRKVPPHDYDAATSALPEQILAAFPHRQVIRTGIRHGTVTVLWEGLPVEVTTFRVDGDYGDGRHPDGVTFTRSLEEDLARRDFTVNAMAWSPSSGLVDLYGGAPDLKGKVLRCVGEPERRFTEDALRILRGLRFAAVLGFSLDEATERGIRALAPRLSAVSVERICEEFVKLLCGVAAAPILLSFPQVIGVFLPEILPCVGFSQRNYHHVFDVYSHLVFTVDSVPPRPALRWAALLHDVGKPETFSLDGEGVGHFYGHAARSAEMADSVLRRLRVDNATRETVTVLIRHHDFPLENEDRVLRRRLNKLGQERLFDLIALMRGDNLALAPEFRYRQEEYDALEVSLRRILSEKQCFSLRDLAVKGPDLMALGYEGPAVGAGLKFLLEAVLDGRCANEKEPLLQYLKNTENS